MLLKSRESIAGSLDLTEHGSTANYNECMDKIFDEVPTRSMLAYAALKSIHNSTDVPHHDCN